MAGARPVYRSGERCRRPLGFNSRFRRRRSRPAQVLEGWQKAGDPRLWKLIVSPEFGDRGNLDELTRGLMSRMEHDLGTRLEWIAVPHFNTEHPHVHIALRGIRDDGTPLKMDRDYIRCGIRAHAEDLCTRQLGLRSGLDAARSGTARGCRSALHLIGSPHKPGLPVRRHHHSDRCNAFHFRDEFANPDTGRPSTAHCRTVRYPAFNGSCRGCCTQ